MSNRKGGRLWARQLFQSGNRQAFVAGTVVGAAIVLALTSQQHKPVKSPDAKVKAPPPPPSLAPRVPVPAPVAAPHPTPLKPSLVDSMPVDSDVVVRKAYTVRYDRRTRNPVWVSELLTRDSLKGETVRDNMRFMEDPAIPERFRSRLDDYRGSGYDRGHLVPAADTRASPDAMRETFYLTNISPQVGDGFNRHYWARLEKFCRELAKSRQAQAVKVISGPAFLPSLPTPSDSAADGATPQHRGPSVTYPVIGQGPGYVAVPTHFFKVILAQLEDGRVAAGAFVLPNAAIPQDKPLLDFAVPLLTLEAATGIQFFPEGDVDDAFDALGLRGVLALPEPSAVRRVEMSTPPQQSSDNTESSAVVVASETPSGATPATRLHLCAAFTCELPHPEFWQQSAKKAPTSPAASSATP